MLGVIRLQIQLDNCFFKMYLMEKYILAFFSGVDKFMFLQIYPVYVSSITYYTYLTEGNDT